MGRKKGSKNRPKVSPLVEEKMEMPDGISELKGNGKRPDGFAIDCDKYDVPPFPEGWEKMGKIERLQWLTAHRK